MIMVRCRASYPSLRRPAILTLRRSTLVSLYRHVSRRSCHRNILQDSSGDAGLVDYLLLAQSASHSFTRPCSWRSGPPSVLERRCCVTSVTGARTHQSSTWPAISAATRLQTRPICCVIGSNTTRTHRLWRKEGLELNPYFHPRRDMWGKL